MKVILFGATGMVGQGVLRECLLAPDVTSVLAVGRTALGSGDPKLREIVQPDVSALTAEQVGGYDACFFCLGVSSVGMSEADYRRITYDLTLSVARLMPPGMTFTYVSGQGTDASGRSMWAKVKGRTEADLLALPLDAYMFRPGFIRPMHGEGPKTPVYRWAYRVTGPLTTLLVRFAPRYATTTEKLGRAMLEVTRTKPEQHVLENPDISALGAGLDREHD
ncbi:epimerase [Cryptosporangium phraense]|uniref:Epimerase n=1 Tax=Cryptosporangium phraense TaxID=2593070 RepID=A0A545AWM4_9ACTN|nr:epimerase [Cryptosporangium phraense]TQS45729.1 epimerase [Cryptosporangium phraense]